MHPLFERIQFQRFQLLLDVILHGFHIVVGNFLDLLDRFGFLRSKFQIQGPKRTVMYSFQRKEFFFAQGDEIFYFHLDAVADQRIF